MADEEPSIGLMFESLRRREIMQEQFGQISLEIESIVDDHPGSVQSGMYLWPAGRDLANYVSKHLTQDMLDFRVIVELGAGVGLVGLTVGCLIDEKSTIVQHAQCDESERIHSNLLILTDHDPGVLDVIESNIERNGFVVVYSDAPSHPQESKTTFELNRESTLNQPLFAISRLVWGNVDHIREIKQLCSSFCGVDAHGVDLILGSDLIYSPGVVEPLLRTVKELLLDRVQQSSTKKMPYFLLCSSFRRVESDCAISEICCMLNLNRIVVYNNLSDSGCLLERFELE